MQPGDFQIEPISETDDAAIAKLAKENNGNPNLGRDFINWWYRKNPTGYFTFVKLTNGNEAEGYATTNNFIFKIGGENRKVAMPQNVLTSDKVRGGGFFGKLYRETERLNIKNGFDSFLTFTNDLSTPIFLGKFGYLKAACPDTFVFPNTLLPAFGKKSWKRISSIPADKIASKHNFSNSLVKDKNYYAWRYSNYQPKQIHKIEVERNGRVVGYSIMKADRKKGIPFLILMDLLVTGSENVSSDLQYIIKVSRQYCFRKGYMFLLFLNLEDFSERSFTSIRLRNRFNFLAKGRTTDDSKMLASTRFNLFFSDMDIV